MSDDKRMSREEYFERQREIGRWNEMSDITREFRAFGVDVHDPEMEVIARKYEIGKLVNLLDAVKELEYYTNDENFK